MQSNATIARRRQHSTVWLVLSVLTLWTASQSARGQDASVKPAVKVLLIGKQPDHPFGTHMYLHTSRMLSKCLARNGVQAVVSDGWPADEEKLKDVAAIVVYSSPAAEYLLDGPGAGSLDKMMRSGIGLVTIHWASSVYEKNLDRLGDRWISYLGGTWVSNYGLSTGTSPLRQLEARHPICRGWQSYELHDEYYLKPVIRGATPLLQVRTKGEDVVVGWSYERPGNGRSYATTLGHFYRNFQREPFRRMVVNGILWTAHVDVPAEGADVALSEDELRLPEQPAKPAKK